MHDENIISFYNDVCKKLKGDYKIILEPTRSLQEDWIEYDTVKWEMEEGIKELVNELLNDNTLSLEEKILKVYEYICLNYVYDANVLYFFKKDNSDPNNVKYIAVDWYGRIVGNDWIEKRKAHNRRICYEFSRFYAKAINTLIDGKEELEAFMLGDKENTHYVVGLASKDCSIILDQDDFNSIKDLTRVKMGLTIKGIHILKDDTKRFERAVEKYNENKPEELPEIEKAEKSIDKNNLIDYFNISINAINKHNIDPQGFFEYIRTIVEKSGIGIEKIWKEDTKNPEKRYERCFYFEYQGKTFLLDSIDKELRIVDLDKIDKRIYIFNSEENEYKYYGG